jgi:hypothetical protein
MTLDSGTSRRMILVASSPSIRGLGCSIRLKLEDDFKLTAITLAECASCRGAVVVATKGGNIKKAAFRAGNHGPIREITLTRFQWPSRHPFWPELLGYPVLVL